MGEFYESLLGLVNGRDLSFFHVSNLLNGNTNPTYQLSLPAKAQGVSFYKMYGDTYMTINASLGRKYGSTVYVYKSKGYASGLNLSLSCTKKIIMPCLLVNLALITASIYAANELFSYGMQGFSQYKIDAVIRKANVHSLMAWVSLCIVAIEILLIVKYAKELILIKKEMAHRWSKRWRDKYEYDLQA